MNWHKVKVVVALVVGLIPLALCMTGAAWIGLFLCLWAREQMTITHGTESEDCENTDFNILNLGTNDAGE